MNAQPLVSILIPTYNRSAYLQIALESAAKPQNFRYEILVGDNASTDNTRAVCHDFFKACSVHGLLHHEILEHRSNIGMVANWNALLARAKGTYIKILCDDDALASGALAAEFAALNSNPKALLCASARCEINSATFTLSEELRAKEGAIQSYSAEKKNLTSAQSLHAMAFHENIFGAPSAVLFRRDQLSLFPPGFQYAADWAAWLELCSKGESILLPEIGCWFRIHDANLTSRFVQEGIDLEEVFRLRWKALGIFEKISGKNRWIERQTLFLLTRYRLARRFAKLLCAGNLSKYAPIRQRVLNAIESEGFH